jgi:FHS family glucose/mannose:H+ symporter-like MFS transporter
MNVSSAEAAATRRRRTASAALHAAFVLSGATTYVVGAMLPDVSARWGVPYSILSYLVPAQFAASSLGAVISSVDFRRSIMAGYACIALGLAGVSLGWPLAVGAVTLFGLGLGLSISATNVLVARMNPHRRGAALATINFLWGVGAVGCQLLFYALSSQRMPEAAPAVLAVVAMVVWLIVLRGLYALELPEPQRPPSVEQGAPLAAYAFLAAQLFLYTGTESTVANWIVALWVETDPARGALSHVIAACFWGALIGGRALAPFVLRTVSEAALYAACLAVAFVGTVLLLASPSLPGTVAGATIAGLGLAPIFALLASMVVARTENTRAGAAGFVFALGGTGAGVVGGRARPHGSPGLPAAAGHPGGAGAGRPGRRYLDNRGAPGLD